MWQFQSHRFFAVAVLAHYYYDQRCRSLIIHHFVEIPEDVVFTVEYSVRAAQIAVYARTGVTLPIPPVTRHDKSLKVMIDSLAKAFA